MMSSWGGKVLADVSGPDMRIQMERYDARFHRTAHSNRFSPKASVTVRRGRGQKGGRGGHMGLYLRPGCRESAINDGALGSQVQVASSVSNWHAGDDQKTHIIYRLIFIDYVINNPKAHPGLAKLHQHVRSPSLGRFQHCAVPYRSSHEPLRTGCLDRCSWSSPW